MRLRFPWVNSREVVAPKVTTVEAPPPLQPQKVVAPTTFELLDRPAPLPPRPAAPPAWQTARNELRDLFFLSGASAAPLNALLESPAFKEGEPLHAVMSDDQRSALINSLRPAGDPKRPFLGAANLTDAKAYEATLHLLDDLRAEALPFYVKHPELRADVERCLTASLQSEPNCALLQDPAVLDRVWSHVAANGLQSMNLPGRYAPERLADAVRKGDLEVALALVRINGNTAGGHRCHEAAEVLNLIQMTAAGDLRSASWALAHGEYFSPYRELAEFANASPNAELPAALREKLDDHANNPYAKPLLELGLSTGDLAALKVKQVKPDADFAPLEQRGRAAQPEALKQALAALVAVDAELRKRAWPPPAALVEKKATLRAKADVEMGKLRSQLLEKSPLSARDAALLAGTLTIAAGLKPRERDVRAALADLLRLTGAKGLASLSHLKSRDGRAYAEPTHREIALDPTDPNLPVTLAHEFGHHREFSDPHLRHQLAAWVRKRATEQQTKPLSELTGSKSYAAHERALPDHFINPYVGKVYESGATEVLSMGLERFVTAQAMVDFALGDPEHFTLTLGVLA